MGILDDKNKAHKIDKSGMLTLADRFPQMMKEAFEISNAAGIKLSGEIDRIVIAGMGGSAISGDIIAAVLYDKCKVPVHVVRDYELPVFVNNRTLFIALSYSGDTEETLSALSGAESVNAVIAAVSSGGKLAEHAKRKGYPLIVVPKGLPPRAATPYLLVPSLVLISKILGGLLIDEQILESITLLEKLKCDYHFDNPSKSNLAKQIAESDKNKTPIYFGSDRLSAAAAYRWKTQLNENSKATAIINSFPELNHNEIASLGALKKNNPYSLTILRDKDENERIKIRIKATKEILEGRIAPIREVTSCGESPLARVLSLTYLGDYMSIYLAIVNGVDPTEIEPITMLKNELMRANA